MVSSRRQIYPIYSYCDVVMWFYNEICTFNEIHSAWLSGRGVVTACIPGLCVLGLSTILHTRSTASGSRYTPCGGTISQEIDLKLLSNSPRDNSSSQKFIAVTLVKKCIWAGFLLTPCSLNMRLTNRPWFAMKRKREWKEKERENQWTNLNHTFNLCYRVIKTIQCLRQ